MEKRPVEKILKEAGTSIKDIRTVAAAMGVETTASSSLLQRAAGDMFQDARVDGYTTGALSALATVKSNQQYDTAMKEIHESIIHNPKLSPDAKKRVMDRVLTETSLNPVIPLDMEMQLDKHEPELKAKIKAELEGLVGKARAAKIKELRTRLHKRRIELNKKRKERDRKLEKVARFKEAVTASIEWLEQPMILQRPEGSMFHKLRQAFDDDEVIIAGTKLEPSQLLHELEGDGWDKASVYVVEHDWASAFEGATDYTEGRFKLPDDTCIFEFRLSGVPVVITVVDTVDDAGSQEMTFLLSFKLKGIWLFCGTVVIRQDGSIACVKGHDSETPWSTKSSDLVPLAEDDTIAPIANIVVSQVRAIAIALDAEVAKSTVIREPHRSNQPYRTPVRQPMYSYHVVSLARRTRVEAAAIDPSLPPRARKRLHFRRGHYRHFQNSKTWVRWCLVGDPDLGFVDKEYRL